MLTPTNSLPLVVGVQSIKAIKGTPMVCRVRVRMRADSIARAFVRTADGITKHALRDAGNFWVLGKVEAENRTIRPHLSCSDCGAKIPHGAMFVGSGKGDGKLYCTKCY